MQGKSWRWLRPAGCREAKPADGMGRGCRELRYSCLGTGAESGDEKTDG